MQKSSENVFIPLTPDELKKLAMGLLVGTIEVPQAQPKALSVADLWHIQRNKKVVSSRRGFTLA